MPSLGKGGKLVDMVLPKANCGYTPEATKEGSERRMLDHRLDLRSSTAFLRQIINTYMCLIINTFVCFWPATFWCF